MAKSKASDIPERVAERLTMDYPVVTTPRTTTRIVKGRPGIKPQQRSRSSYGAVLHPDPSVRDKALRVLAGLPELRAFNPDQPRDEKGRFAPGSGSVEDLPRGPARSAQDAATGCNPRYGSTASMDAPTYREAGKSGERYTPEMGPLPSGAFEENCTNAVMAFEMRARGYDVEAAPLDVLDKYGYAGGRTYQEVDDLVARAWSNPDGSPHGRSFSGQRWRSFKEIDAEIRQWPEGGRGFITTGKHVFSVVRQGGKARYIESQFEEGPSRDVTREYKQKYKGADWSTGREEGKVIRLDDLEPTDDILETITVR